MDTRETGRAMVGDVLVVREFTDIFPEELPGIPLERHVKFISVNGYFG